MSDGGLENISLPSLPPCRNIVVKSRLSTYHFITEVVNITIHIASGLHVGKSVFRLCESSSWTCATRWAFIIFLLSLNFSIITHLIDMHFWPMSGIHSNTQWISIFSISLFFASITFFACYCSDVSKTTFSQSLTSSVSRDNSLHWSTWSQLVQTWFSFSTPGSQFSQWIYFH